MDGDLKLDDDEGILLESDETHWTSHDGVLLMNFILTNKRIYCVYEENNGIFKSSTEKIVSFRLSDIKIIDGQLMVHQADHAGEICLRIQFKQGIEYFSFYYSVRKKILQWVSAINKAMGMITEENAPEWDKRIRFCPLCGHRVRAMRIR